MIDPRVALILGNQDYDLQSCHEAGRANQGFTDAEQLEYATSQGRAILTFNTGDFRRLHRVYRAAVRRHAGIIVSGRVAELSELVRRLRLHLDTVRPEDQANEVLVLAR